MQPDNLTQSINGQPRLPYDRVGLLISLSAELPERSPELIETGRDQQPNYTIDAPLPEI